MGINGLLQALKPISKQVHVRQYQGQRVAVDGYSWLHKGAYCCARELCEGIWTDKYISYFLSRVQLLRTHGVEPVIVFDGGRLPIKGDEEESRHRARAEARAKAAAHLAAGNLAVALECYQRCVDITPAMAKQVIEELKAHGVAFLVAPYEADAQMAYLARTGQVQVVVTEDSDLLAYGCPRVLYKLDKTGTGDEVCLEDLPNCPGLPMSGWTSDQFLQLCVMAGCDFLAQLPGIGLKKAHGVLRKYRSFTKVVKMLRFNGTKVPPEYEAKFQLALWAFRHARVYCTAQKALVHLAPLPGGGIGAADVDVPAAVTQLEQQQQDQRLDFLGPLLPAAVAQGIAEGELDPSTHQPFDLAAIYAGCTRPPAHLAAQLASLQPATDAAGDPPPCSSSQGAAAYSGGAAATGKPRVGLSRRHAGQGGSGGRRLSTAGGASGGASRQPASASGSGKRRSSLGIAKYFKPPAAAAAVGAAASGVAGSASAAVGAAAGSAAAAAAPADVTAPACQSIRQSIAKAISTLDQRLQQRQDQQQAGRQQLLQQQTQQQQQQQQQQHGNGATGPSFAGLQPDRAVDGNGFGLPAAKRQRHSECTTGEAAAASQCVSSGADDLLGSAADGLQPRQQATPSCEPDPLLPSAGTLSSAGDASLSLGLGSAAAGADGGSSWGAGGPGASQHGLGLSSSDPSFLRNDSDTHDSQQGGGSASLGDLTAGRAAPVSALSALFAAGARGRGCTPAVGDAAWDGSSPLFTPPDGSRDLEGWCKQQGASRGAGAEFVLSSHSDQLLGSMGPLGDGSSAGGSLDGCGSSSGLSPGVPGSISAAAAAASNAAAVLDGTASVSIGEDDVPEPAAGGAGASRSSFLGLQQSLRVGLRAPAAQQAPKEPSRSSFFAQPAQVSSARRHSRFREQLMQGSSAACLPPTDSPEDASAGDDALQDLHMLQEQQEREQHHALRVQSCATAGPDDGAARALQATQPLLQVSDSSDPSSGSSTSNDENAALQDLGITHVKKYAKLAHKLVKSVAKQQLQQQQQQQHSAPLAPIVGLLNTPAQQQQQQQSAGQPVTSAARQQAPRPQQKLQRTGGRSTDKRRKGAKGSAGTGLFAAPLAELRYDASMFVPVQQREQDADAEVMVPAGCQATVQSAAAARQPFKMPWLAAAAAVAAGSPGCTKGAGQAGTAGARQALGDAGDMQGPAGVLSGFGAFGAFACAGGGSDGAVRCSMQPGLRRKRAAASAWR